MARDKCTPLGIEGATEKELLAMILRKLSHLENMLTGNDNPEKGIIVRMDRLEQSEVRRVWLIRAALSASIAALMGVVWKIIGVNH